MLHTYSPQTELIGLHLSREGDRTASGVMKSTNPTVRWNRSIPNPINQSPKWPNLQLSKMRLQHTLDIPAHLVPFQDLHHQLISISHVKQKLSGKSDCSLKNPNPLSLSLSSFITIHVQIPKTPLKSNTHKQSYQSINVKWQRCHFKISQTLNPLGMAQIKRDFPSPNGHICTPTQSLPNCPR